VSAEHLPATLHPVLRRVLALRGVTDRRELEPSLAHLHPPSSLNGLDRAVDLLAQTLETGGRTLVVGDFDADGATSSALAVHALRAMGGVAGFLVPNRFEYGYGLTPEIVAVAARHGPDLLITVDNGISSLSGVEAARARGMRVLITDHHLPGPKLPAADAVVNPNLPGDPFPSKHLAGVGVIFYVLSALRQRLRGQDWFARRGIAEPNMAEYLDLVALGTVADVVPLDHNNRILVEQGLRRIRAGRCRAGIRALLEVAGRDRQQAVSADLAFAVAPRLNAAGRLTDMALGIECLLSEDEAHARHLARQLDGLNRSRREIEAQMQAEALAALDALELESGPLPAGLCLFDAGWHQGVIGILAARIKERVHRPVIAFAPAEGGQIKGSARSIVGLHIRDVLDAVARDSPGLIARFGGHAMAAGLSLDRGALPDFREAFVAEVSRHLGAEDLQGELLSDGELADHELTLEVAETLRLAGPWGQGFPPPLFDGAFRVLSRRPVGDGHLKMMLGCGPTTVRVDAIAFRFDQAVPEQDERVRVAYRLDVNDYQGRRSPQLIVEHLERD
jgi:single-stranded-DNA-specific exonuclease